MNRNTSPVHLTTIGAGAFSNSKKLVSVKGGAAVKTIGSKAFAGCSRLKTFKITSKALSKIGKSAFKGCKKLKKVNVKNSKKAAYKKLFTKKNCGKKVKLT